MEHRIHLAQVQPKRNTRQESTGGALAEYSSLSKRTPMSWRPRLLKCWSRLAKYRSVECFQGSIVGKFGHVDPRFGRGYSNTRLGQPLCEDPSPPCHGPRQGGLCICREALPFKELMEVLGFWGGLRLIPSLWLGHPPFFSPPHQGIPTLRLELTP